MSQRVSNAYFRELTMCLLIACLVMLSGALAMWQAVENRSTCSGPLRLPACLDLAHDIQLSMTSTFAKYAALGWHVLICLSHAAAHAVIAPQNDHHCHVQARSSMVQRGFIRLQVENVQEHLHCTAPTQKIALQIWKA